ncbi:basic helix-loop-helix DNA-binding superfamily protein [Prunus dulcis]|uniref:Basic helix-loop-helix DNA-binding superfamily protein n=1 Tax=Prunus dulcis TaxID=3755 RepID=A0A4Y1QN78_PRUDU|nr:basic helix-loop-helix DNA-binding superfamily protein [Prunus dulcis]
MSHIAVERNRRKQMNEHLKVLRSLTPCFYIKRGDQASIIGRGVIEFIKELHQVLQSLESNKRRRALALALIQAEASRVDNHHHVINKELAIGACCNSPVADVEAKISGSNVVLKIISRRTSGQIAKDNWCAGEAFV